MDSALTELRSVGTALTALGPRERLSIETMFVLRLARLARLRSVPVLTDEQRKLVDHAMYSTYWDCVQIGLRNLARHLLGLPSG